MPNIFERVKNAVGIKSVDIDALVQKKVQEQTNLVNNGDVVRFSPRMLITPNGGIRKSQPLGVNFQTLRDFADYYPVARACIEFRKSQITHLDYAITPMEVTDQSVIDEKNVDNARELKKKFKYPTGKKDITFTNWIKQILEDLLVIDAVAIYRKKNRRGDTIGYLPIDASTIELLLEKDGTTPEAPNDAYIQRIFGLEQTRLTADELIYRMMTPRTHAAFGFAPLETLIITVTTALKLQAFNLAVLCYDDQTEILTKSGWKYFKELFDDDIVATRSKEGKFEWQKILSKHEFDYDDNLVRFKSATVDLFVTPNHRMLTDYRSSYGKFDEKNRGVIKRADWFIENDKSLTQNYLAPTKSVWNGITPEYFSLEETDIEIEQKFSGYAFNGRDKNNNPIRNKEKFLTEKKKRIIHLPEIRINISDWLAFLGIYLAEGWCRKENDHSKHEVYVSQKRTSRYWVDIDQLLNRLPFNFKYNERTSKWSCSDKQLWTYLKKLGHSYHKYIPTDIKNYDRELLDILWLWMFKGDGHLSDGKMRYSTVSNKLAGDVQEILQKIGYDPKIVVIEQQIGRTIIGKEKPIKTAKPIYRIHARVGSHRSLSCATYQYYKGKVNSVKVPNGIVYVRRNGNAIWCGNTEGNVPEGFVSLPRDIASSRDQLKEWQDAWDAMLSGDPRFQRKLKFLPDGMKYEPTVKESDMTFERFEKWLLQCTTSVFGLHPSSIGFNFDVNRATSEVAWEAGLERGLFPTALFLKELLDQIIQEDWKHPELQFTWTNIEPTNKLEEAKVVTSLVNGGLMAIDEWRLGEGLRPVGVKDPFIMTPVGPIFVKDLAAQSAAGQEPVAPYQPTTGQKPSGNVTNRLPITSQARVESSNDFLDELRRWKKVAINDFKDGKPIKKFKSDIIDNRTYFMIEGGLKIAKSRDAIFKVFEPFLNKQKLVIDSTYNLYEQINTLLADDAAAQPTNQSPTVGD